MPLAATQSSTSKFPRRGIINVKVIVATLLGAFSYLGHAQVARIVSVQKVKANRVCAVTRESLETRDPVAAGTFRVNFFRYRPLKSNARIASVVMSPSSFGLNPNEGMIAQDLCERGVQSFLVKDFTGEKDVTTDWWSDEYRLKRGTRAILLLSQLSTGPVAALGTCIGGIFSILAAHSSEKFKAAVVLVSGVPFAEIVALAPSKENKKQKQERWKRESFTDESYRNKVARFLPSDPSRVIKKRPHFSSLMLIAGKDTSTPTKNQWQLWELLGRPRVMVDKDSGHIMASVMSGFRHGNEIVDFLVEQLR